MMVVSRAARKTLEQRESMMMTVCRRVRDASGSGSLCASEGGGLPVASPLLVRLSGAAPVDRESSAPFSLV